MRKTLALLVLLVVTACAPQATAAPTAAPTAVPAATSTSAPAATDVPLDAPTEAPTSAPADGWQTYTNPDFGFSFRYPPGWFGPEVYVAEGTLRAEIGSDVVYPYGTGLDERQYFLTDSYYIVFQYTKNNTNTFWQETYQALEAMQDGETRSDARSMIIRVRALELGRFRGFEYISTLSETAQTEPVYSRSAILVDDQSNLLTVMGSPNNVQPRADNDWRAAYRAVDEAYRKMFAQIIESIEIE